MDQPLRPFEHGMKDALRRRHLPQDVHVDAAMAAGDLMSDPGLGDGAANGVGDQLFMPLAPGLAVIDIGDELPIGVTRIGVDTGECSHTARGGPRA